MKKRSALLVVAGTLSWLLASAALFAVPVVTDDFEGGTFSADWDDTTGATINNGTGAEGSANFASIGAATGPLGALIDGGASEFAVDFYVRVQATGNRQLTLMVGTGDVVATGNAAINLRHRSDNGWAVFQTGGGWQQLTLPTMAVDTWYRVRLTCRGWGEAGSSYEIQLSDGGGNTFTSSATGLAFYQTGDPNSMTATWFSFNSVFGGNPGFDIDNVVAETSVPVVDDPNISLDPSNPFAGIILAPNPDPVAVMMTIGNTGATNDLVIADTTAITGEAAANYSINTALPLTIPAGGTADLEIEFDDGDSFGTFVATLAIVSNDATTPSLVVPLSLSVPAADGNQLGNGNFEESAESIPKWDTSATAGLEGMPAPGIAPGSVTAAIVPAMSFISQDLTGTAGDWFTDFYFQIAETPGRAFNIVITYPGGQITLRYQDSGIGGLNSWNIFTEEDSWGDPLGLPALENGATYRMRIIGHGWDSGTPTYDLLLSEPGGVVLENFLLDQTRFRTNPPTGGPTQIRFTNEFGGGPGFLVDDVRLINGAPPEDFPLEITGFVYNGDTNEATITWSTKPNTTYFIFGSSDLRNWNELDDSGNGSYTHNPPSTRYFYRILPGG